MGLFDKLKAAAKYVTGGGAKVSVEALEPSLDRPFKVRVGAVVSEAELSIDRVYLNIRAEEEVRLPKPRNREQSESELNENDFREEQQTFRQEFPVSGAETLSAGGEYSWEAEISLPSGLNGTYIGRNAWHRWYIQAGLDAKGNDPDSGWVEIKL